MSSTQPASETPRKYQLLIDGQWVDAESGKTFDSPNPATGQKLAEVAEGDKADIDKAVEAARRAYEGKWSKMSARDRGRLLYKLSQLIEVEDAGAGRARNLGQRQADPRVFVRRPAAGRRELRILRRLGDEDRGRDHPGPRPDVQLHAARTHRRLRPDHPVELPAADGRVEARARARRRQHGRPQARRADARHGDGTRQADSGGGLPRRRRQHRPRLRRDGGRGARLAPRRR